MCSSVINAALTRTVKFLELFQQLMKEFQSIALITPSSVRSARIEKLKSQTREQISDLPQKFIKPFLNFEDHIADMMVDEWFYEI